MNCRVHWCVFQGPFGPDDLLAHKRPEGSCIHAQNFRIDAYIRNNPRRAISPGIDDASSMPRRDLLGEVVAPAAAHTIAEPDPRFPLGVTTLGRCQIQLFLHLLQPNADTLLMQVPDVAVE